MTGNIRKLIIIFLSAISMAALFAACDSGESIKVLSSPKNLQLNEEEILTWDKVENASGYKVDVDGTEYDAEENSLDLFSILNEYGTYEIKVYAVGDYEFYLESEWSQVLEYTLDAPKGIGFLINDDVLAIKATDASKVKGKLIVPEAVNDIPVTTVFASAFQNCTGLTSVLIPDSVTVINNGAFEGCTSLIRVKFPEYIETLSAAVFSNCTNLRTVNIPVVRTLPTNLFEKCSSLTSVVIPEGVEEIDVSAFRSSGLTEVYISSTVELIDRPFLECSALSKITVAEGNPLYKSENNCIIRKTDNAVVQGCKTSVIPQGVTAIDESSFYAFSELKEITLPEGLKTIGAYAFAMTSLSEIVIPASLTSIGSYAFKSTNITSVTIPENVTEIVGGAFNNCQLTDVSVAEGNKVYKSESGCIINKLDNTLVLGTTKSVIPDYIETIGKDAFSGNKGLKSISVPGSVRLIDYGAFSSSGLESITLSYGLQTIGQYAFAVCASLRSIIIPESVTTIENCAFDYCAFLSIIIPDSVTTIRSGFAFYYATIYTSFTSMPAGWSLGSSFATPCVIFFGCTFGYDGETKYVKSVGNIGSYFYRNAAPYREGYTFGGWALEEGSTEALFKPYKFVFESTNIEDAIFAGQEYIMHTSQEEFNAYRDSLTEEERPNYYTRTLYAIWIPDNASD